MNIGITETPGLWAIEWNIEFFHQSPLNDDISPGIHFYGMQQIYLDWGKIQEATHVIFVYISSVFWKIETHSFSFFPIFPFIFHSNQKKFIWSCSTQNFSSIIENCKKIQ